MPQIIKPKTFVFRDSLQLDTIWLDSEAIPAKLFNPLDTPDLVLFNVDSSLAHMVRWDGVDTAGLIKVKEQDSIPQKSFLNVYTTPGKDGIPELTPSPSSQLILSASVLLILFASFSVLFSQSKLRIGKYFFSLFNKRRFKEYVLEENPRLLPTLPLIYVLQSILLGSVSGFWIYTNRGGGSSVDLLWISLLSILGFAVVPMVRNGAIYVLGNVFMIQQDAKKHIFISYLTHTLLFMLLLPLGLQMAIQIPVLAPYFNTSFYICFGLAMTYQLYKLIENASLPDLGALVYIFLYFCTLEILPLVVIYKAVEQYA